MKKLESFKKAELVSMLNAMHVEREQIMIQFEKTAKENGILTNFTKNVETCILNELPNGLPKRFWWIKHFGLLTRIIREIVKLIKKIRDDKNGINI